MVVRHTTGGWRLLLASRKRDKTRENADWSRLLALVPKTEHDELRQMLVLSRQRGELLLRLIYQQRYKNVLEAWLYVHVPLEGGGFNPSMSFYANYILFDSPAPLGSTSGAHQVWMRYLGPV